tara:strand:- start:1029 stop:1601 length:573 start_codon:yes stop_codon:yes gene_type:complete
MAKDYKFALWCIQDKVGSDNATINVFVNGTQVGTNLAVVSESADSPTCLTVDAPGLADPNSDGSVTAAIKVVLSNNSYVDASNDRNVWITNLDYMTKAADGKFYALNHTNQSGKTVGDPAEVSDFSDTNLYHFTSLPTAVTGSQIPDDFWAGALAADSGNGQFYHIPVWGDDDNTGTTITFPLKTTHGEP